MQRQVSIIVILFFIVLCMCNPLSAKKAERLIKVGVVDIQKVFAKSPGKKIAEEALEKKREKYEKEKVDKVKDIKDLQEEYENKKYTMDDNEKEKMQLEIDKKKLELKQYIEKSNEKLEKEENKLLAPIIDDIKDVIRAVSIKYGYHIILDKSTYVLYYDKEFDITKEVLNELKVKYKK